MEPVLPAKWDEIVIRITTTPPNLSNVTALVARGGSSILSFSLKVEEDDMSLPSRMVKASVSWGFGLPTELGPSAGINTFLRRTFTEGLYQIKITAENYKTPKSDTVAKIIYLSVESPAVNDEPVGAVFGPILPKDGSSPNKDQWNLDRGVDVEVIASDVKALLISEYGSRIMKPGYGTNLRRIVFESDPATMQVIAREEISTALLKWEPRAVLNRVAFAKNGRNVVVTVDLTSRVEGIPFVVEAELSQP